MGSEIIPFGPPCGLESKAHLVFLLLSGFKYSALSPRLISNHCVTECTQSFQRGNIGVAKEGGPQGREIALPEGLSGFVPSPPGLRDFVTRPPGNLSREAERRLGVPRGVGEAGTGNSLPRNRGGTCTRVPLSGRAGRHGSRSCGLALALGKQIDRFAAMCSLFESCGMSCPSGQNWRSGDPPDDDQLYSALSQISGIREIQVCRLR